MNRQPDSAATARTDAVHWYNKAVAAQANGKLQKALPLFRKALSADPTFFEAAINLGNLLDEMALHEEAVNVYRKALQLRPNDVLALSNLGQSLTKLKRYSEAEACLTMALQQDLSSPAALLNSGNLYLATRDYTKAVVYFKQAQVLLPASAEIQVNMAHAYKELGEFAQAQTMLMQILQQTPDNPRVLSALGNVMRLQGEFKQAREYQEKAITVAPDNVEAHWHLAQLLLLQGEYARGWEEYEWRARLPDSDLSKRRYRAPQWNGKPLQGKTLLLYTEQGCGDAIQFVRYTPLIEKAGGKVVLQCQAALTRLFATMAVFDEIITLQDKPPRFDCHASVMSLPHIFATTLESVPHEVPYFNVEHLADIPILPPTDKLKVGLVWGGNPEQTADKWRSMQLHDLAPLLANDNVQFYSLQVGARRQELADGDYQDRIIDLAGQLEDYAATAGVIAQLDLVISVCTSVAHLAGALARPVWIALAHVADYRWLTDTDQSPWYPSARLFRQTKMGDWASVVSDLKDELKILATA